MNIVENFNDALDKYVKGDDTLMRELFSVPKFKEKSGSPEFHADVKKYLEDSYESVQTLKQCLSTPNILIDNQKPFAYFFSYKNILANDETFIQVIFEKIKRSVGLNDESIKKENALIYQLDENGKPLIERVLFPPETNGLQALQVVFADHYMNMLENSENKKNYHDVICLFEQNYYDTIKQQPVNSRNAFDEMEAELNKNPDLKTLVDIVKTYAEKISADAKNMSASDNENYMVLPFYLKRKKLIKGTAQVTEILKALCNTMNENDAFTTYGRRSAIYYAMMLSDTERFTRYNNIFNPSVSFSELPILVEKTAIQFAQKYYLKNAITNEKNLLDEAINDGECSQKRKIKL